MDRKGYERKALLLREIAWDFITPDTSQNQSKGRQSSKKPSSYIWGRVSKQVTNGYWDLEKTFISRHILHHHWYTCPIALPVRQNLQHTSLLTVVSSISAPSFRPLRHERNLCHVSGPSCEQLYATNTPLRKQETFLYEYPLHWVILRITKTHNWTLLLGNKPLKHGRHFNYWNQALNMRMRVCYLDCHYAGLRY
jgi:hypothetical protein